MPFQKGNKLGKGRGKGTPNKRTIDYLNLQRWFARVDTDLEQIDDPKARVQIAIQVIERLLAKISNLPSSPIESVTNAEQAWKILTALEKGIAEKPSENPVNGPTLPTGDQ